jgi:hypothetical protein
VWSQANMVWKTEVEVDVSQGALGKLRYRRCLGLKFSRTPQSVGPHLWVSKWTFE